MRSRHARRAGASAALATALLVACTALADKGPPESRRARALFEEGVALSDEGKWADALSAFQRSDQLVPSPSARYNVGTTLRALGRYVEAKRTLESVLADAPTFKPPMKPALKRDVEKVLTEVKARIVLVSLKVSPVDADVQMDGSAITRLPDGRVEVDPGKHVFVAAASGHETTTVAQLLTSDADVVLSAPRTALRIEVVKETPVYARAWFITTLSVAVAGAAAVGIIFAAQPRTTTPAGPPDATVQRVIPAAVRF